MNIVQFHRIRSGIQANASPGVGPDLTTMEKSLRSLLLGSGVFAQVEVEQTDDPDHLVIALCEFDPAFTEQEVAQRLETIWRERVSYTFWEAHATYTESQHVEFEAATRSGSFGHYVTVHLVAKRAEIPAQRSASD